MSVSRSVGSKNMTDMTLHAKRTRYWLSALPWLILGTVGAHMLRAGNLSLGEAWPSVVGILIGCTIGMLVIPMRGREVRLSGGVLTGPMRHKLRTRPTEINISAINLERSHFGGFLGASIRLTDGRNMNLSTVLYARSEINALCREIESQRSQQAPGTLR